MPGMMPFGLKIAIINRAFRKRMDEKAADMGLTSVPVSYTHLKNGTTPLPKPGVYRYNVNSVMRITWEGLSCPAGCFKESCSK